MYANDPLQCFFAEMMGCLEDIASQNYTNDTDSLLETISQRSKYLTEVSSRKIFTTAFFTSKPRQTKGHVMLYAVDEFDGMLQDGQNISRQVTLIESLRKIEARMKAFVMHGISFASSAYCDSSSIDIKAADLLTCPGLHKAFRESSLGRALVAVLKGPAKVFVCNSAGQVDATSDAKLYDTGPLAKADMVRVQSGDKVLHQIVNDQDAANSITNLLYCVNTGARCSAIIRSIISVADDGGRLLVLGVCKEHVKRWLQVSMACLDGTKECMNFYAMRAQTEENRLKSLAADPNSNPWMKRQQMLKGRGGHKTVLTNCGSELRDQLASFGRLIDDFNVRQVSDKAMSAMKDMAEDANRLYNDVAPSFGFQQLAQIGHIPGSAKSGPALDQPSADLEAGAADGASSEDAATTLHGVDTCHAVVDYNTTRDPTDVVVRFKKVDLKTDDGTIDGSRKRHTDVRVLMSNPNRGFHKAISKTMKTLKDKTNVSFKFFCDEANGYVDIDDQAMVGMMVDLDWPTNKTFTIEKLLTIKLKASSPAVHPSGVVDYIGLLGCNSLYEVLGISRDASDKEIKKASKDLLLRVSSDKVKASTLHMTEKEQQYVYTKIREARLILLDQKTRGEHNKTLDMLEGNSFKRRLQEFNTKFRAMSCGDGTEYNRNRYFWFGIGLFIGGVVAFATVVTAGVAMPIALGVGAAAGFMVAGGTGSAAYAINNAQGKFSRLGFLKHLFIYGAFGAAAGTGIGALSMLGPYVGISIKVVESLTEGAIEGAIVATSVGGGDIATIKALQTVKSGATHLALCMGVGALAGGGFGAIAGGATGATASGSAPAKAVLSRNISAAVGALGGTYPEKNGWQPADWNDVEPADDLPKNFEDCVDDEDDLDDDIFPTELAYTYPADTASFESTV